MSKIKIPDGAVIMADAPVTILPDELLEIYENDKSEANLARCYADARNQAAWLSFEVDEPDCPDNIKALCETWWDISFKLSDKIKEILIRENYVVDEIGTHYMVMPFMERNGYRDGCGWWVPKDE